MPIRFVSSAAQICFWIFMTLSIVSSVVTVVFRARKAVFSRYLLPLPTLALSLALICYLPSRPMLFGACFLLAISDARAMLRTHAARPRRAGALDLAGRTVRSAGLLLLAALMFEAYPTSPLFVLILAAVYLLAELSLLAGKILLGTGTRPNLTAVLDPALLLDLFCAVLALILLIVKPLYSTTFLLVGCLFFFAGELLRRLGGRFADVPIFLGQIILFFGLALAAI